MTKPVVRLLRVESGVGPESQNLLILWNARDANLGPQAITLSFAERADGPWVPIASHLDNTGRYEWKLPAGAPVHFLLRVEAIDRAGNISSDQTPKPLFVDLNQPNASIVDAETGTKAGHGEAKGP